MAVLGRRDGVRGMRLQWPGHVRKEERCCVCCKKNGDGGVSQDEKRKAKKGGLGMMTGNTQEVDVTGEEDGRDGTEW